MQDVFARTRLQMGREPLSMAIARQIETAILSGELADGTPFPSEKDLAAQLQVGRSTVREALRILQARGLVTGGDQVSTRGPVVNGQGALPNASSALQSALLLGQVSLTDLVSLRLTLEEAALRAATAIQDQQALQLAHHALDKMRQAQGDISVFQAADVDFHAALAEASGNRAFSLVMEVLRSTMSKYLTEALQDQDNLPKTFEELIQEHEKILFCIEAGDADAAAEHLRQHVRGFYERRMP